MGQNSIEESVIEQAKQRSIHDILGFKDSRRRAVRCPFHSEKTPSCIIYADNRGYHCFGCGAHGRNAIDFIMGMGNSFTEAIKYLTGHEN